MPHPDMILVIGANGQIGSELVATLRTEYGSDCVIATDIRPANENLIDKGPFEQLDVLDKSGLERIIRKYKITTIYHLAAMLSAIAESKPLSGWNLNMGGLLHVLQASVDLGVSQVFWPSSIAAFGNHSPGQNTPQWSIMDPNTVYGISKLSGESWCNYYYEKKNLDVRSLRFPGLISYKTLPGGGTTDYAVDIFHHALKSNHYTCFLKADTRLPMMYMPDAIRGALQLMDAPTEKIKVRTSYNFSAIDFTPAEIAAAIKKVLPGFSIDYNPDFRQAIAESWPESIDDMQARKDWDWKPGYNLDEMVADMLQHLRA